MKVKEVPQDARVYINTVFSDMSYALDDDGNYVPVFSDGWEVKNDALDIALDSVNEKCEEKRQQVLAGKLSPLAYHLEKNLMDVGLVAKYTGLRRRTVKKHLKPDIFAALEDSVLQQYADALRITTEELRTVKLDY
jgi:hypothetical protein